MHGSKLRPRLTTGDSPLSKNTYQGAIAAGLTPVLKFFSYLPEIGAAAIRGSEGSRCNPAGNVHRVRWF
jgi:hypothetical protein